MLLIAAPLLFNLNELLLLSWGRAIVFINISLIQLKAIIEVTKNGQVKHAMECLERDLQQEEDEEKEDNEALTQHSLCNVVILL